MSDPLVSIVTPCYNMETYVSRFLESILSQTYTNIELIFINDGSTDSTEKIALSYKERFQNKGVMFHYIYQENTGQSGAINNAIKLFSGDYLTWPDSDDWLLPTSIEKRVTFLETHKEYSIVMCDISMVDELGKSRGLLTRNPVDPDNFFLDLITEKNIYFAPVGYMVRSADFLQVNPLRQIYVSRKNGQNWQMLLPLAHKHRIGYINEVLGYYLVSHNSHSRQAKEKVDILAKYKTHEETLLETFKSIPIPDIEKYTKIVKLKYIRARMKLAMNFKDKSLLSEQYNLLRKSKQISINDRLIYLSGNYVCIRYIYELITLAHKICFKIRITINMFRR